MILHLFKFIKMDELKQTIIDSMPINVSYKLYIYDEIGQILFNNNIPNQLYEKLIDFQKLKVDKIYKDKVILKNNALKYSKFRHYLKISEILN